MLPRMSRGTPVASLMVVALAVAASACGDETPATTTSSSTSSAGGASGQGGSGAPGGAGASASTGGAGTGGQGAGPVDTCGIGSFGGGAGGIGGVPTGPVRVVAANLSTGNNQAYDGGEGIRILQGLDADVVLIQEMNFGSDSQASIDVLVENICEGDCVYERGPQAQIPNGVISRFPILECGSWVDPEVDNRNFVWARIDVPGDADLWAISVHLLSSQASRRQLEAIALMAEINGSIPSADLIVLGGDLNTNSRGEAAVGTFSALFDTSGPYPQDQNGNDNTNEPRSRPYDWVLADDELTPFAIPTTIGQTVFPFGAVIDTRVYQPLAEIAPAQVGDSGAPSMQHMAVVRDFLIAP